MKDTVTCTFLEENFGLQLNFNLKFEGIQKQCLYGVENIYIQSGITDLFHEQAATLCIKGG